MSALRHTRSLGSSRRRTVVAAVACATIAGAVVSLPAQAEGDAPYRTLTQYTQAAGGANPIPGNATLACRQVLGDDTATGYKLDRAPGTEDFSSLGFSVSLTSADGKSFTFTGATPAVAAVIVKGASNAVLDTNAYVYDSPVTEDLVPLSAAQSQQSISHITFCVGGAPLTPVGLLVMKTASGTSNRVVGWDLEKSVDVSSYAGDAGAALGTSTYTVTATKGETEQDFHVSGTISIQNDNAYAVPFTVTDTLGDGTHPDVTCPGGTTVAASSTLVCSYSADTTTKVDKNTATVVPTDPAVSGGEDVVLVDWATPTLVGVDDVTVLDTFDGTTTELGKTSATKTFTYGHAFSCPPSSSALYVGGTYVKTFHNDALISETGDTDFADVTVTCKQRWVGETAVGAGTRYTGTANWFTYTQNAAVGTSRTVDLIAGQTYKAGTVTLTRTATGTTISLALNPGFRFKTVSSNVKIQGFELKSGGVAYVSPGSFANKYTVLQSASSFTTPQLKSFSYYGVHVDVERLVP